LGGDRGLTGGPKAGKTDQVKKLGNKLEFFGQTGIKVKYSDKFRCRRNARFFQFCTYFIVHSDHTFYTVPVFFSQWLTGVYSFSFIKKRHFLLTNCCHHQSPDFL
jgi:hypothetical protein